MIPTKHNNPFGGLFDTPANPPKKEKPKPKLNGVTTSDAKCWPRNGGFHIYECCGVRASWKTTPTCTKCGKPMNRMD